VSARDEATVERLYRDYGDLVLRRARRIMGSESEAQEILQELFMSFVERPQQLAGKTSLTGWLYGATTHLCLNTLRNRKNRARLLQQAPEPASAATSNAETRLSVQELLGALPDPLGQVAVYYYLDEMTHEEIAEIIGISRRHVGNLLQQINERMQARP
jgi:RNA polymerase sigma-70 factor (ECF subfamily)